MFIVFFFCLNIKSKLLCERRISQFKIFFAGFIIVRDFRGSGWNGSIETIMVDFSRH